MKTKNLFYALAMGVAFTACSQEEIVNDSANLMKGDSFKDYSGEVYNGGISFVKDGEGVDSRMTITHGNPSWIEGDQVGLVWLNAEAAKNWNGVDAFDWTEFPTTNKIFSNTRMSYDATTDDFFMTDGQVFKGLYMAYYPYDKTIQNVQQFRVKQSATQEQTDIIDHTLNEVATNLVWMSQRYENNQDIDAPASLVYEFVAQDLESGTADQINVRMKPFSNILDARFNITDEMGHPVNHEEIIVEKVELFATTGGNPTWPWPTQAAFDMSKWGDDNNRFPIESAGGTNLNGRKLFVTSTVGTDFYKPENQAGKVTVTLDNEIANAGKQQRANFMFLPWGKDAADLAANYSFAVKVYTNYGWYVANETSDWKTTKTNNGGANVNPIPENDNLTSVVAANKLMKDLVNRIGMQAVRYFEVDVDKLTYNDIEGVESTAKLCEVLQKWNDLGKSGELRIYVANVNDFANLNWSKDNDIEGQEAIAEFLADDNNKLVIKNNTNADMNLSGETVFNDVDNQLTFEENINQTSGTLTVEAAESVSQATINAEAALNIPAGGELFVTAVANLNGTTDIEQNGLLKAEKINNNGVLTTNGEVVVDKLNNNAEYHILYQSETTVDEMHNYGKVYYDEQGTFTPAVGNWSDKGTIIATIKAGNTVTTLAEYLKAANSFKCTDLEINSNEYLTTEQWNNNITSLNSFTNVLIKDGVTLSFAKDLGMKNAVVTIAEGANVTWTKTNTLNIPTFKVKQVVLGIGATLTVEDLSVNNKEKTVVKIGNGLTTTLNAVGNIFANEVWNAEGNGGTPVVNF